jgi:hypothetical protein
MKTLLLIFTLALSLNPSFAKNCQILDQTIININDVIDEYKEIREMIGPKANSASIEAASLYSTISLGEYLQHDRCIKKRFEEVGMSFDNHLSRKIAGGILANNINKSQLETILNIHLSMRDFEI